MMLAPAVLPFGIVGLIVSATLGAIQAGMGLRLTTRYDPTTVWHRQYDSVFALATAGGALALAAIGDAPAAIFLIAVLGVQTCVNFATRYVAV